MAVTFASACGKSSEKGSYVGLFPVQVSFISENLGSFQLSQGVNKKFSLELSRKAWRVHIGWGLAERVSSSLSNASTISADLLVTR